MDILTSDDTVTKVLIGLGSNIEPRIDRIQEAIAHLTGFLFTEYNVSPFYRTAPVGFTQQSDFINAVIVGNTSRSAIDVHSYCKNLEKQLGRIERERWHERELDIDVLLYGSDVVGSDTLTIPHPRMHERGFVLVPACDVAPMMIHPVFQKSMLDLLFDFMESQEPSESDIIRL